MKNLILITALLLLCVKTKAQITYTTDLVYRPTDGTFGTISPNKDTTIKNEPKKPCTHIIIYRTLNSGGYYFSGTGGEKPKPYWEDNIEGFYSLQEALDWLNIKSGNWRYAHPSTRITENELVGIYDISKAKKIEVKIVKEKKSKPKEIIIEKEEWTEEQYIIQK